MVMPSWAPASVNDNSSIAFTAARAERVESAASRGRLAAVNANSAATKNPFAANRSTLAMAAPQVIPRPLPSRLFAAVSPPGPGPRGTSIR